MQPVITNETNVQSLVLYKVLLSDAEAELKYIESNSDLSGRDSLLNQFKELIISHKNNIARLNKQIENPAEAKSDLEKFLTMLENVYNVVKHFIPAEIKTWIEKVIAVAKELLKQF